jgi:hypothetical protein
MDGEINLMNFEQMQKARLAAEADFQRRAQEEERRQHIAVRTWLSPANAITYQERYLSICEDHPATGRWLLEHDRMREWLHDHSHSSVLWINGIPGAGSLPSSLCAIICRCSIFLTTR